MELKPGYKQTEVGVIPKDWRVSMLSSLATMKSGESITSTNIDQFSRYPCYGGNGLRGYTMRFTHDGRYALIGRHGALCGNVLGVEGKFFASEHAVVVTPYSQTDIRWLTFVLGEMRLNKFSESSAQPGLSVAKILSLATAIPSTKAEQEAIAEALSDADALIESVEQLIAKKRQIKQGAMQELLTGKRRLPGFETKPGYKQTEVGMIPEDWALAPIGEHFEFKNGLNKAKQFFGTGKPIVNYMDVYAKSGLEATDIHGKVSLSSEERQRFAVKKGDVFFTRTSETLDEVGLTSVLLDDIDDAVFSGFILRARPTTDLFSLNFKKYCFRTKTVRNQITSSGTYTTRALTNGRYLSRVKVPLPPTKAEQETIATILSDMETEITALETKLSKARQIKQGMMQELLTGRIRLV